MGESIKNMGLSVTMSIGTGKCRPSLLTPDVLVIVYDSSNVGFLRWYSSHEWIEYLRWIRNMPLICQMYVYRDSLIPELGTCTAASLGWTFKHCCFTKHVVACVWLLLAAGWHNRSLTDSGSICALCILILLLEPSLDDHTWYNHAMLVMWSLQKKVSGCLVFTTARYLDHLGLAGKIPCQWMIISWGTPMTHRKAPDFSGGKPFAQLPASSPQALLGEKILDLEPPDDFHRRPSLDVEPGMMGWGWKISWVISRA